MKKRNYNNILIFNLEDYDLLLALREKYASEEEIAEAEKYILPKSKYKLLSYIIRRIILSQVLESNPQEIIYTYNEFGKPMLESKDIFISASLSEQYFAFAFSSNFHIGVDIEVAKEIVKQNSFMNSFLSHSEKKIIKKQYNYNKTNFVFMLWTMKESLLKTLGYGLSIDMKRIEIIEDSNHEDDNDYILEARASLDATMLENLGLASFASSVDKNLVCSYCLYDFYNRIDKMNELGVDTGITIIDNPIFDNDSAEFVLITRGDRNGRI